MRQASNSAPLRILHLEDSTPDHELVKRALSKAEVFAVLTQVDTLEGFSNLLSTAEFDVILADYRLPGFTALDAWQVLQKLKLRTPFVLLSGAIGETAAVAAIQLGMSDYLPKADLSKLGRVVNRALEVHHMQLEKEAAHLELAASEKRLASFAEHLQSAIEQERAAIAREIHDDIGGSLAAIRFDLAWAMRHTHDESFLSHLSSANEMLSHALQASQRIMMNLRPAVLDQGLVAALHWLTTDFSKRTSLPVNLRAPQKIESLSKAVQLTAYRTAQEALTNISKYACCSAVRVELSDSGGLLTLEISDDGVGVTEQDMAKASSFGIRGLKERARTVGGWVDVSSTESHGTSITLSIPLDAEPTEFLGEANT